MIEADVAVVGGSFAGVSAAIMLARARRRVVIIDEGARRNRFAHASHGFLGMDGAAPEAILEKGLAEVLAYPTARHVAGRVTAIGGSVGALVLEGAEEIRAARGDSGLRAARPVAGYSGAGGLLGPDGGAVPLLPRL